MVGARGDGCGGADSGVRAERRLDFAQFDAEAAQFDLMVRATEELNVAVRQEASEVAGAVEARARAL